MKKRGKRKRQVIVNLNNYNLFVCILLLFLFLFVFVSKIVITKLTLLKLTLYTSVCNRFGNFYFSTYVHLFGKDCGVGVLIHFFDISTHFNRGINFVLSM